MLLTSWQLPPSILTLRTTGLSLSGPLLQIIDVNAKDGTLQLENCRLIGCFKLATCSVTSLGLRPKFYQYFLLLPLIGGYIEMTKVLIFGNVNSSLLLALQLNSKRVQALVDTQMLLTICID